MRRMRWDDDALGGVLARGLEPIVIEDAPLCAGLLHWDMDELVRSDRGGEHVVLEDLDGASEFVYSNSDANKPSSPYYATPRTVPTSATFSEFAARLAPGPHEGASIVLQLSNV